MLLQSIVIGAALLAIVAIGAALVGERLIARYEIRRARKAHEARKRIAKGR